MARYLLTYFEVTEPKYMHIETDLDRNSEEFSQLVSREIVNKIRDFDLELVWSMSKGMGYDDFDVSEIRDVWDLTDEQCDDLTPYYFLVEIVGDTFYPVNRCRNYVKECLERKNESSTSL